MHCKSNKIYKRTYRLYMDCTYVHICANFANFALHDTESFFEISSHIQHKDNGHAICYKHIKDSVVKK